MEEILAITPQVLGASRNPELLPEDNLNLDIPTHQQQQIIVCCRKQAAFIKTTGLYQRVKLSAERLYLLVSQTCVCWLFQNTAKDN